MQFLCFQLMCLLFEGRQQVQKCVELTRILLEKVHGFIHDVFIYLLLHLYSACHPKDCYTSILTTYNSRIISKATSQAMLYIPTMQEFYDISIVDR